MEASSRELDVGSVVAGQGALAAGGGRWSGGGGHAGVQRRRRGKGRRDALAAGMNLASLGSRHGSDRGRVDRQSREESVEGRDGLGRREGRVGGDGGGTSVHTTNPAVGSRQVGHGRRVSETVLVGDGKDGALGRSGTGGGGRVGIRRAVVGSGDGGWVHERGQRSCPTKIRS